MSSFTLNGNAAGDIWVGYMEIDPGNSVTVKSMSSGKASWVRVAQAFGNDSKDYELWIGRINATGSDSVNLTFTGSVSSSNVETGFQEFTSSRGRIWLVDTSGFIAYTGSSNNVLAFPTLDARNPDSLYWGYGKTTGTGSAGATAGYSYDASAPNVNVVAWGPDVSGVQSPTAQSGFGNGQSIAVILTDAAAGSDAFLLLL